MRHGYVEEISRNAFDENEAMGIFFKIHKAKFTTLNFGF
jgi:hypothetical protein